MRTFSVLFILGCIACASLAAQLSFHSYTNSDCTGTEISTSLSINHCFGAFGNGAEITAQSSDTVQFCTFNSSDCSAGTQTNCATWDINTCHQSDHGGFSAKVTESSASSLVAGVTVALIAATALMVM